MQQAEHCHLESRRRLFSKETDIMRAPQVASVVSCSGIADTKGRGIGAACSDEGSEGLPLLFFFECPVSYFAPTISRE